VLYLIKPNNIKLGRGKGMKRYTKTHEWVSVEDGIVVVGITRYAQEKLGDVVFVELPEVGKKVKKGEVLCTIESVKAASDVYAPVSGEVEGVNEELDQKPELVNEDPEGKGWIARIKFDDESELEDTMDENEYREFCEKEEG